MNIGVLHSHGPGEEEFFKVTPTTKLQEIFTAYSERTGVPERKLFFSYRARGVDGDQTVADIGLEHTTEDSDQQEFIHAQPDNYEDY